MKYIYLSLIALFCSNVIAQQSFEEQIKRLEQRNYYAENAFVRKFESSLKGIKSLGPLLDEKTKKYSNRYDESPMVVKEFVFDGLIVESHFKVGVWDNAYLTRILVSTSAWSIKQGLIVGTSKEEIMTQLGKPDTNENNVLSYCGETDCVSFTVSDGKIKSIEISYYLD
jgi:hypothetical protein